MDVIITELGARPGTLEDTTPIVLKAMNRCRKHSNSRLVFPKGQYHFFRDGASEYNLYTSNNDSGIKRIGMPLFHFDGLEIDGQGSQFIFHGRMIPLAAWDSTNIRLRNFSIDWDRPFTLEGVVLDWQETFIDIKISPATPYVIRHGRLSGLDDECYPPLSITLLEYDTARREFAHDSVYPCVKNVAQELEPGRVRLNGNFPHLKTGREVLMRMELRHSPAMSIGRCADVEIRNVAVHASAGMGLIAQESRNLHLDNLRITPTPDSGRVLSAQDDATHFCNCRGLVLMENCLFENCWDDGSNIHGIYRAINMRGPNWTVTQSRHFQQLGVGMGPQEDDLFEFIDPQTMETIHQDKGYDFKIYNAHETAITYRQPLPDCVKVGTCIANISATPDVTVRKCIIRNTRPRGVLVNTPGKVVVEDNVFHTPGAAVLIGADCNSWYESGSVRNVLVQRNLFDNCRYTQGTCTPAPISIIPAIPPAGRGKPFESNIRIENNHFRAFDPLLMKARSVNGLSFKGNVIERNSEYPPFSGGNEMFDIDDCVNITIQDNQVR